MWKNRDILSMTIGNVYGTWVHNDQAYITTLTSSLCSKALLILHDEVRYL